MRKIVFVVGAGASKDFGDGMPVGVELAQRIEISLNKEFGIGEPRHNGPMAKALRGSLAAVTSETQQAIDRIRDGLFAVSIDDLLHEWRDFPETLRVGKIAIAKEILEAENTSVLGRATHSQEEARRLPSLLRDSWLAYLVTHRRYGIDQKDIQRKFENFAFIVFNYDRCVELFLFLALQTVAGLTPPNAVRTLKEIPIVHPYGDLGALPLAPPYEGVDFGATVTEEIAQRIKTYTENDHDIENLNRMHDLIANSERVIFLGFGYHERNLDLLFSKGIPSNCEFWGVAMQSDPARIGVVRKRFDTREPDRFIDGACAPFLKSYRQKLLPE